MRKPSCCAATAALFVVVLCSRLASAATLHLLFKSGDAATDGSPIGTIENPIATAPSTVVFRGTTSALLVKNGATFSVIAKTGDPLPAPLSGTFNDFGDPVINDGGAVAFDAGLNSTAATRGAFLYEGGTLVPITLSNLRVADINGHSDVLLTGKALILWSRSTGTLVTLVRRNAPAPGDAKFGRFGRRPVLNDAGVVAFESQARRNHRVRGKRRTFTGIFTDSGAAGSAVVAQEGETSPAGGSYPRFAKDKVVSINAAGEVAFLTFGSVLRYEPVGPSTTMVAGAGDPVGTDAVQDVSQLYVGVDSHGGVGFIGRLAGGGSALILASGGTLTNLSGGGDVTASQFAPRLTDAGHVVWQRGDDVARFDGMVSSVLVASDVTPIGSNVQAGVPSMNGLDVVTFRADRLALYLLTGGAASLVAAPGDVVAGGGTIRGLSVHAVGDGVIAFVARDAGGGGTFLATARGGNLTRVIGSGAPSPLGGTLVLDVASLDVQRSKVFFASSVTGGTAPSGLFRVDVSTGTVDVLAKAGGPATADRRFADFGSVHTAASGAVFRATLDDQSEGLFLTRGARARAIVVTGEPVPGRRRRTVAGIGPLAVSGGRVLFSVNDNSGDNRAARLLLWKNGRVKTLAAGGRKAAAGGRFALEFSPVAMDGRTAAFIAGLDGTAASGLFLSRGRKPVSLVLNGVGSPVGGTVELSDEEGRMSLVGSTVIFLADLVSGAEAKLGLFSVAP